MFHHYAKGIVCFWKKSQTSCLQPPPGAANHFSYSGDTGLKKTQNNTNKKQQVFRRGLERTFHPRPQPRMLPGELTIDRSAARWAEGRPATPRCAAPQAAGHTLCKGRPRATPDRAEGQRCGRASPPRPGPAPGRSPPHTRSAARPRSRPRAAGRGHRPPHRPAAQLPPPPPQPAPRAPRPPPPPPPTARGSWAPSFPGPAEPSTGPLAARAASTAERAAERARFCAGAAAAAAAAGDRLRRGETGTHVTLGAQLRAVPPLHHARVVTSRWRWTRIRNRALAALP